jgi:hypothetical protein
VLPACRAMPRARFGDIGLSDRALWRNLVHQGYGYARELQ